MQKRSVVLQQSGLEHDCAQRCPTIHLSKETSRERPKIVTIAHRVVWLAFYWLPVITLLITLLYCSKNLGNKGRDHIRQQNTGKVKILHKTVTVVKIVYVIIRSGS